jgi:hypothetical protein
MSKTPVWFAARLLFVSQIEGEETLFEETMVLLRAQTEAAAIKRAIKLGEAETHSYQNGDNETVSWVFSQVLDLIQLDTPSIEDGTEVYHHFLTAAEVDQVRESLKAGSLA